MRFVGSASTAEEFSFEKCGHVWNTFGISDEILRIFHRSFTCTCTIMYIHPSHVCVQPWSYKAYGPAAALKCYLEVIGWAIDDDGHFVDHLGQKFQLPFVSRHWLHTCLWNAWDIVVTSSIKSRSGMQEWPEIDLRHTRRVQLPMGKRESSAILIQRSLGTLFATQRDHWGGEEYPEEVTCPMCGGPDTRAHFPMLCTALDDLRLQFHDALESVKMNFPHMCFLPIIYKHPKMQLLQSILREWKLPPAFQFEDFEGKLQKMPVFYTDGSCPFPKLPGSGLASWSVVWDSLDDDFERRHVAKLVRDRDILPETLIPIQASLVFGPQTVNRAELTAIIQVIRSVDAAVIYSDSAWAITAFERVIGMNRILNSTLMRQILIFSFGSVNLLRCVTFSPLRLRRSNHISWINRLRTTCNSTMFWVIDLLIKLLLRVPNLHVLTCMRLVGKLRSGIRTRFLCLTSCHLSLPKLMHVV